jgi:tetratricopeptide (TPR) repeat protein
MPSVGLLALVVALLVPVQEPVVLDPALGAVIERFYETQEQEDVDGYLGLWSRTAARPTADQLTFVFESGDDRFADLRVTRAHVDGDRARVRLEVTRTRTRPAPAPHLPPITTTAPMRVALELAREDGEWRLVREGPAGDALAADLIEAATADERDRLIEAETDLVDAQLFAALARHGSTAAVRGAYPQSLTIFEEIVRLAARTGHRKEEGEALQNMGNALYFMQRYPAALDAYERRLALERERDDEAAIAAALAGIATIRYSTAEYSEALARYREALAIHERLGDAAGLASATLSIGHIAYLQGDFTAAVDAYARSLSISGSMSHADGESRALEGLGRVHAARGDFAAAVEAFKRVRGDPRMRAGHDRLGTVAQFLGDVHMRLGNLDLARDVYTEGRRHFQARDDLPNVGRILQALAFTELLAARSAVAEAHYNESAAICEAAEDGPCRARAVAALGYARYSQGNFWGAATSYRTAIAAFVSMGRREDAARAEVGLAQALTGAGDAAGAIEAALRARREAEALGNDDVLWRALLAEARAIRRIGQVTRAFGPAHAAVRVIERMDAAALDRPGTSVPADAGDVLGLVAMLEADAGDAQAAFAAIERMRAIARRARLAPVEREIARGMTAEERDEERRHAVDVLTVLAQVTRETELPRPDMARLASLQQTLDERTRARRAWMAALFERLPDLRTWRGLADPPSHAEASRLLTHDGEVLLSLVVDLDGVLAVTVRHAEGRLLVEADTTAIPRREVIRLVGRLQQLEIVADATAWREAARASVSLLPPRTLDRLAAASRLYVLPHDILWRIPFGALPVGRDILLERAAVLTAASLDGLLRSADHPRAGTGDLVAIGSPAISTTRADRLRETAPGWSLAGPARVEAELGTPQGSGRMPVVLTGPAATEGALRSHASRASVLHIAAPFRLNPGAALFSPILLTEGDRGGGADDGALELRELFNLEVQARLAVLSDGAALSMREAPFAADVLQWSWLGAGVPSLLVSRWSAASDDASRVLTRVHRELRSGRAPADALRTAQLEVRADPATAAPYHWAGWLMLGAW